MPRPYPHPNIELLKNFIVQSVRLENLPMDKITVEKTLIQGRSGDVSAVGHFSAINLVLKDLAVRDDLIPTSFFSSDQEAIKHLSWLLNLHAKLTVQPTSTWRAAVQTPSNPTKQAATLGNRLLPRHTPPHYSYLVPLMSNWLRELIAVEAELAPKVAKPHLLVTSDLVKLASTAHQANLHICAIKPFQEANGQTARLVENLLRLRWSLPWMSSLKEKEALAAELQTVLEDYPEHPKPPFRIKFTPQKETQERRIDNFI